MKYQPLNIFFLILTLNFGILNNEIKAQEVNKNIENSSEPPSSLIKAPKTTDDDSVSSISPSRPLLKPLNNTSNDASTLPKTTILPETQPYSLGAGDIIKVDVYGIPEQGGEYQVFMDGTVSIPLIGSFKIEGQTIEEVNQLFLQEYARYLKRPIVTVTLIAQRPLQLAISGEVNNPGNYTINLTDNRKNPTISDLFAQAGGLTVSADVSEIQLKREEDGIERIYTLNFWQLLQEGKLEQDVDLRDGDVVIVPKKDVIDQEQSRQLADASFGIKYAKAPTVTLVGEINRPGSYTVPIEDGPPRVTTALQQGGGIKDLANIREIIVKRTTRDGTEQVIPVDLWAMLDTGDIDIDVILKNGDTIVIPTATDINPAEAQALASANFSPDIITVNVIGSLKNPGATELPPNTSLNNAILAAGGFHERRANDDVVQLVRFNPNGTVTKREIEVDLAAGINEKTNPVLKNNDVVIVGRNTITQVTDGIETLLGPIGRTFSVLNLFNLF